MANTGKTVAAALDQLATALQEATAGLERTLKGHVDWCGDEREYVLSLWMISEEFRTVSANIREEAGEATLVPEAGDAELDTNHDELEAGRSGSTTFK